MKNKEVLTGLQAGSRYAVILVGHGGVPRDFPREQVRRLKALEAQRRASGAEPSEEEIALDRKIRTWPRTAANDPYRAGLQSVAVALQKALGEVPLIVAYNEFCAPDVEEAVESLVARSVERITVLSSMLTPGGVHSEIEIPETLGKLRARHPGVDIRYAWPLDLEMVADLLARHVSAATSVEGSE
jgi:sirohydrochlorin cobaltochelatase